MVTYVVLGHTDPGLLRRLVDRLSPAPVHVHIDASRDLSAFEARARLRGVPNASYVEPRTTVNWGGYSVVRAMIAGIVQAAPDAGSEEHIVFLSGQCYPIVSPRRFESYLRDVSWRVHARAYSVDAAGGWHRERYQLRHGFDGVSTQFGARHSLARRASRRALVAARMVLPRRRTSLDVVAGSQWMALTRECALEAVEALNEPEYQVFRDAYAPDEMAIQTFVHNSRWRNETEFGGPEPIPPTGKISALANFHQLDALMVGSIDPYRIFHPSPRDFFARKFDSVRDETLLNSLDEND